MAIDLHDPTTLEIERLEPHLFHLLPNYASLLEEVSVEMLTARLLAEQD